MKIYFIAFLIQFSIITNATAAPATVYFIPFQIETLVPITSSTVTCQADEIWKLDTKDGARLASVIVPIGYAYFDEYRVRVKIEMDGVSYYIDSNGVVLKEKISFQINKNSFNKFVESVPKKQRKFRKDRTCPSE